jgi:Flp pilus assembly pilin Flp
VKASLFLLKIRSTFSLPPPLLSLVREFPCRRWNMTNLLWKICFDDEAQDIAEYAVMLAVILVIVVGTIRLVGSNANNVFSSVASSVQ